MRPAIILSVILLAAFPALPETIHVPADYPLIQAAINHAKDGDTVLVGAGTYEETIDYLGKAVQVVSEGGPDVTVIDGQKYVSTILFRNGEGPSAVLDGFTVTNGTGFPLVGSYTYGGGVFCGYYASPTLKNNIISSNTATYGAGVFLRFGSSAGIQGNVISENTAGKEGGGVFCVESSPKITGNTFDRNKALSSGGGLKLLLDCHPEVTGNTFLENTAVNLAGGGIQMSHFCSPVIMGNTFIKNAAKKGASIYLLDHCSPTVEHNAFLENSGGTGGGLFCDSACDALVLENTFTGNTVGVAGGGIYCLNGAAPTVRNNRFIANTANYGGAIGCIQKAAPSIENNLIADNTGNSDGGGIYCADGADCTIVNNIISGNGAGTGGGIFCGGSAPVITHNTFYGNSATLFGGGMRMFFQSAPVVTNCILWNNQAKAGPAAFIDLGAELSISYSDVEGGKGKIYIFSGGTLDWGPGMIDADPLFVDAGTGDFHLLYTSPCRDAGDGAAPGLPIEDFEGDPRIAGAGADLGADEFHPHLYYTGDAVPGGSIEIKITGTPGTAPLKLWAGSGLLEPPLPTLYGDWYLDFPLIFEAAFGAIPSPEGIRILPLTLPPSTPVPLEIPMQALVGNTLVNHATLNVD